MSSSSPSTPDDGPPWIRPGALRSTTVPAKLMTHSSPSNASASTPAGTDKDVEVLYSHRRGKIVSFNTSQSSASRPSSSAGRGIVAEEELTSWTTPTERMMAVGPLQIYRARLSGVAFLHSGHLLHPIMSTSQCWCVDGESKFVLRVRDGLFYRMELPCDTEDDKTSAEDLKAVLSNVLRYEKTPCPFKRSFHVELPEAVDDSPTRVRIRRPTSRSAKKWKLRGVWVPEDAVQRGEMKSGDVTASSEASESSFEFSTQDSDGSEDLSNKEEGEHLEQNESRGEGIEKPARIDSPMAEVPRRRNVLPIRSITAPPQMKLFAESVTEVPPQTDEREAAENDTASLASSRAASFHTAHSEDEDAPMAVLSAQRKDSAHTPLSKQHIGAGDVFSSPKGQHTRGVSEVTVTDSVHAREAYPSPPSTPTLVSDMDDVGDSPISDAITPPDVLRLRRAPKELNRSKLASAASMSHTPSILSPAPSGRGKQLTSALVQKVCSLILGPPAHLVALMLRIAAKIANGANILHSFDLRDRSQRMAGTWEDSEDGDDDDDWDEDEDAFGAPLADARSSRSDASFISAAEESSGDESAGARSRRLEVD